MNGIIRKDIDTGGLRGVGTKGGERSRSMGSVKGAPNPGDVVTI